MGVLDRLRAAEPELGTLSFADTPVVMRDHRFRWLLDTLLDDALGVERASRLRMNAARDAVRPMLVRTREAELAQSAVARIQAARAAFSELGEGRFQIETHKGRRRAVGAFLYDGYVCRRFHGARSERAPSDGYAAGYISATIETTLDRPHNSVGARETTCVSQGGERCLFDFVRGDGAGPRGVPEVEHKPGDVPLGSHDTTINELSEAVSASFTMVDVNRYGLRALGSALMSTRPLMYDAYLIGELYAATHHRDLRLVETIDLLLQECAAATVFHFVGRSLAESTFDDAMNLGPVESPLDAVCRGIAILRAMGWGQLSLLHMGPRSAIVVSRAVGQLDAWLRDVIDERPDPITVGATLALARLSKLFPWSAEPREAAQVMSEVATQREGWSVDVNREALRTIVRVSPT